MVDTIIEMTQACSHRHADLIKNIAAGIIPDNAQIIYKGRNTVYSVNHNGDIINIKSFKKPSFPNNYIYTTFRRSKARRSFENAQKLIQLGINTPAPLAYVEIKEHGRLTHSYYFSQQMDNLQTVRDWNRFDFTDQLLDAMALFMKELIDKQIYHRDFSPGNILFERLDNNSFRFYLVDLNRMEFDITDPSKFDRMFRAITLDPTQNQDLARRFALACGLDIEKTQAMAARQLNNYFAEKARNARLKSLFKTSS